jgi:hypothetical protein
MAGNNISALLQLNLKLKIFFPNSFFFFEKKNSKWFVFSAAFKRNSSLTKGEIDAYWRAKKKEDEEEHFGATTNLPDCNLFFFFGYI